MPVHEQGHAHAHPQHPSRPASGGGSGTGGLLVYGLIILAFCILAYNQAMIFGAQNAVEKLSQTAFSANVSIGTGAGGIQAQGTGATAVEKDLSSVDLSKIKSTQQSVAAVFPVERIKSQQDAIDMMIPTGTPEYGQAMGVSFDDPVKSLSLLASSYPALKADVEKNNPAVWKRFMALASKPVGLSCEYCCGIGPIGIDKNGNSACGCQHNPAILTVTLWLMENTQYSDAQVLKEGLRWKSLFFPKNMVDLAMQASGTSSSAQGGALPGMVGGC